MNSALRASQKRYTKNKTQLRFTIPFQVEKWASGKLKPPLVPPSILSIGLVDERIGSAMAWTNIRAILPTSALSIQVKPMLVCQKGDFVYVQQRSMRIYTTKAKRGSNANIKPWLD
jgi:hypothetical protein